MVNFSGTVFMRSAIAGTAMSISPGCGLSCSPRLDTNMDASVFGLMLIGFVPGFPFAPIWIGESRVLSSPMNAFMSASRLAASGLPLLTSSLMTGLYTSRTTLFEVRNSGSSPTSMFWSSTVSLASILTSADSTTSWSREIFIVTSISAGTCEKSFRFTFILPLTSTVTGSDSVPMMTLFLPSTDTTPIPLGIFSKSISLIMIEIGDCCPLPILRGKLSDTLCPSLTITPVWVGADSTVMNSGNTITMSDREVAPSEILKLKFMAVLRLIFLMSLTCSGSSSSIVIGI